MILFFILLYFCIIIDNIILLKLSIFFLCGSVITISLLLDGVFDGTIVIDSHLTIIQYFLVIKRVKLCYLFFRYKFSLFRSGYKD